VLIRTLQRASLGVVGFETGTRFARIEKIGDRCEGLDDLALIRLRQVRKSPVERPIEQRRRIDEDLRAFLGQRGVAGLKSACLDKAAVVTMPRSLTACRMTIWGMVSPVSRATFLERMSMARTMRRIDFITLAASFACMPAPSLTAILPCWNPQSPYTRDNLTSNDFSSN
jgi:hypothetical protein